MFPVSGVLGGGRPLPGKVGTDESCGGLERSFIHHARDVTQGVSISLVGWIARPFPRNTDSIKRCCRSKRKFSADHRNSLINLFELKIKEPIPTHRRQQSSAAQYSVYYRWLRFLFRVPKSDKTYKEDTVYSAFST